MYFILIAVLTLIGGAALAAVGALFSFGGFGLVAMTLVGSVLGSLFGFLIAYFAVVG